MAMDGDWRFLACTGFGELSVQKCGGTRLTQLLPEQDDNNY